MQNYRQPGYNLAAVYMSPPGTIQTSTHRSIRPSIHLQPSRSDTSTGGGFLGGVGSKPTPLIITKVAPLKVYSVLYLIYLKIWRIYVKSLFSYLAWVTPLIRLYKFKINSILICFLSFLSKLVNITPN